MTKEEKAIVIEDLTAQLANNSTIYLADISGLDALATSASVSYTHLRAHET